MKRNICALLLAVLLIGLVGCGGEKAEPDAPEIPPTAEVPATKPEPEKVPEQKPEVVPEGPGGVNPLTGEAMDPEKESLRPVAVMFNNIAAALPQMGISQADIIYEVPAEGGITRMLGIYKSMDGIGTLGSIRSTRAYYLELALGHDALLVHAGASPEAYEKIPIWGVNNMDGVNGGSDAQIFWRDAERRKTMAYEHTLVTSGEKVLEYLAKGRYRTEHEDGYTYSQQFAEEASANSGSTAEHFKLYYTSYKTGVFEYDNISGTYLVSEYGKPYVDGNTGEQVSAANVLILETDIEIIPGDKEGRLTVRTTGTGEGTFFCGGKMIPMHWSRADRNSPFVYTTEDGLPLVLQTGCSYVCLVDPNTSRIEVLK